ncbi:hypothetical protein DRO54_00505 [Candidatus Bathyarchaeota archaeon]|nr:MAG: hypothetical protein DRO54_00505 [Candidatus Bathyarchaeota archaeon]
MNYEIVWKVLSDLATELKKRGEVLPPNVMKDLRSAKTMIEIIKADPTCTECIPKIESYLDMAESALILHVQEKLGPKTAEEWMRKIETVRKKAYEEEMEAEAKASKFVPGVPRDQSWIRIEITNQTPKEIIENITKETGLSCEIQEDSYALVYGEKERIKEFVRKMAERLRKEKFEE